MPLHPINLEDLVADALATSPDATRDELEAALIAAVQATTGRTLTPHQRSMIGLEVAVQWQAREQAQAGCPS